MSNKPAKTFRDGAVGLSVWERQGKKGAYYDFTLSRSYRDAKNGQAYSGTFREGNGEALIRLVSQAVAWIREQGQNSEAGERSAQPEMRPVTA